jgi:hypothetical protein
LRRFPHPAVPRHESSPRRGASRRARHEASHHDHRLGAHPLALCDVLLHRLLVNGRSVSEKKADAAALQGLIDYVESGAFEAWLDEVVRADEATRRGGKPPEVVELEADVRKQEARVEKVGRTLLDVGVSDYLRAALRQEEDKLRGLRLQLAAAVQRQPAPGAKLDVAEVAALMRNLSDVAANDPAEARRVMAEVVESVVLRSTSDGPEAEVTLKNETAALAHVRALAGTTTASARIPNATPIVADTARGSALPDRCSPSPAAIRLFASSTKATAASASIAASSASALLTSVSVTESWDRAGVGPRGVP